MEQAVAPNSYQGAFVSSNVPMNGHTGERLNTEVIMRNTGTSPWTLGQVRLYTTDNPGIFNATTPTVTVQPNHNARFDFIATLPTTANANYPFSFQLNFHDPASPATAGFFGPNTSIPVNVNGTNTPRWSCSYVGGLPSSITAGTTQNVTVTIQNTGYGTWSASNLCLRSRDDVAANNLYLWGNSACPSLPGQVLPGASTTLTFQVTAPSTPATYPFTRQIQDSNSINAVNGVGLFDLVHNCINTTIQVTPQPTVDNAVVVSSNVPSSMAPGDTVPVSITFRNTGNESLSSANAYLRSNSSPVDLFTTTASQLTQTINPNGTMTFNFNVTAPTTPNTYSFVFQMYKTTSPNIGYFGTAFSQAITVSNSVQRQYSSTIVSQSIPTRVFPASQGNPFSFVVRNSGSQPWTGPTFGLQDVANPRGNWGVTFSPLNTGETVAPGATRTFSFGCSAITSTGTVQSQWQMTQTNGIGFFGAIASGTVLNNACGDHIVQAQYAETCDPPTSVGALPTPGCNTSCRVINRAIDLASATAERTFVGAGSGAQLGNVAIGDVNHDGFADVVVGESAAVWTAWNGHRVGAGTVHVYAGSSTFFNNASTTVPTSELLEIRGAVANDQTGGGPVAGLVVADVTADGIPDIIASSHYSSGQHHLAGAGAVYVIRGGSTLSSTHAIDLGAPHPSSFLVMQIFGAAAGDNLQVMGAGNLFGNNGDVVIGASGSQAGGANAGRIYVVHVAGTSSNTLDLAHTTDTRIRTIIDGPAGSGIGRWQAAIGDVNGDGTPDLAIGAPGASPGSRTNAGAVWVLLGPLASSYTLGYTAQSNVLTILGPGAAGTQMFEHYGSAVNIANVRGTSNLDLVVGANQFVTPGPMRGGAVDVYTGPLSAGLIDLSTNNFPSSVGTRIRGPSDGYLLGWSLSVADMNGDGFGDIVAGGPGGNGPLANRHSAGEFTIELGAASMANTIDIGSTTPPFRVYDAIANEGYSIGSFAASTGDIDHDGHPDVCVAGYLSGGSTHPGLVNCWRSRW